MDKRQEIINLIDRLNEASREYYQNSNEIMTNKEYDDLYDKLVALEKETGIIMSNSPTVNVGSEIVSSLPKEAHEKPMLSLDKTKSVDDLQSFLGDKEGLLSWKLDGLTVVLTYNGGKLTKALTRGNGSIGEIITSSAKCFENIPLQIPFEEELIIRGEAIISYSDFERINEDLEEEYKNPRNLCSGTIRSLDSSVTLNRHVKFVAFNLVSASNKDFATRKEQFEFLFKLGFEVVEYKSVDENNIQGVVDYFRNSISSQDYPCDGLVLIYDDIEYGKSLGMTSKFPKDSIAFKWQDETSKTILRDILWSPSRTGLLNPVAIFDPVEIEGTTVSRASLHNVSIVKELQLGIGDEIEVYKANMIIPQVATNLTKSNNFSIPDICPICGSPLTISNENGSETLVCNNIDCPIKRLKSFTLFVSRDALNIEGLSEKTIEKLIDNNLLNELSDIFNLKNHKDKICKIEGLGEKSFDKLIQEIENKKTTSLYKIIYGIGIPGIGLSYAKLLCKYFDNDIEQIKHATEESMTMIDGFGKTMACDVFKYFNNELNIKRLDNLLSKIILLNEEDSSNVLDGKQFVVTGTLNNYNNRRELLDKIEALGGKIATSVSKNTDYLINNDINSSSTKNKKAKELGIQIITENEFDELIRKD